MPIYLALVETVFIIALLVVWLTCDSVRSSKNLWILFFYSFPAMFLVGLVPHEPVLFYFSKFHPALVVTLVAIAGTLITEYINYCCLAVFFDLKFAQKYKSTGLVTRLIHLFDKFPFLTLVLTSFTPVPFFPFRFLAVISSYSKRMYLLSLFVGRFPRVLLFTYLGHTFQIPDKFLLASFLLILLPVIVKFLIRSNNLDENNPVVEELNE